MGRWRDCSRNSARVTMSFWRAAPSTTFCSKGGSKHHAPLLWNFKFTDAPATEDVRKELASLPGGISAWFMDPYSAEAIIDKGWSGLDPKSKDLVRQLKRASPRALDEWRSS